MPTLLSQDIVQCAVHACLLLCRGLADPAVPGGAVLSCCSVYMSRVTLTMCLTKVSVAWA